MSTAVTAAPAEDSAEILELRVERARLALRLASVEQESDRLAITSAILVRLYEAASCAHLLAAVRDVLVNLVGVEVFELYASPAPGAAPALVTISGAGVGDAGEPRFAHVAADIIRQGARRAVITPTSSACYYPAEAATPLASAPLLWHGTAVGALVVQRLLPQKPALTPSDGELLDFIGTHVLPALSATAGRASAALPRWTLA